MTDTVQDAINKVIKLGFNLRIEVDYDGDYDVVLIGGDCNCPHRKPYDRKDGHGFTMLEVACVGHTIQEAVDKALELLPQTEKQATAAKTFADVSYLWGEKLTEAQ